MMFQEMTRKKQQLSRVGMLELLRKEKRGILTVLGDGDYPCGNEADMLFARRVFSIREMAYLQLGLAAELNPDDLRKAPPFDKIFDGEAMPKIITTADQPTARRGFVNECLGHYAEAIECYEAIE